MCAGQRVEAGEGRGNFGYRQSSAFRRAALIGTFAWAVQATRMAQVSAWVLDQLPGRVRVNVWDVLVHYRRWSSHVAAFYH